MAFAEILCPRPLLFSYQLLRFLREGSFGPKMPATSVTISGASRTRAFSATWPPYTPASIGVEDDRQSGPYCQVEIRTLPVRTSGAALSRSSEAASDQGEGGDLVFLERELLLRSYNSVSLSDDGTFSLTLSDCHGFMPISTSSPARQISSASRPSHSHDEGAAGRHESPTAEIVRLLFLPLPLSVEFEVNSGQATSSGAIIGNFHLLPIAHTPQLQHPPAFNAETTTTSPGTSTVGRADYTPGFPVLHEPSCTQFTSATATADSLCDRGEMVCTGEGPGVGGRTAPSSLGGCFVAGAAVGVVLCLLLALVIGRRGWAKDVLEHMWTLLKGEGGDAGMRKAGWRSFIFSVGGAKKDDGVPHDVDARSKSDDSSSDSDATLIENVPEPVGLPRSEEDWRALFDTLYED